MADEEIEQEEMSEDDQMLMIAQEAGKVGNTLESPGWKEIIKPMLQDRREYYLTALLTRQENMEDVVFAQQSVLVIDELMSFIDHIRAEGKRAEIYYKEKNGSKDAEIS